MDILSALKKSVLSVKEWVDENKVQKVSGKGLSTNDYTTIEKNKVAAMPNDLVILDGKLFLAKDGTPINDSAVTLPSGGGGGGGSATVTLKNLLDSSTITTAVNGKAILKFSFASSETEDDGICYIYVGGNLKGTVKVISGQNEIDVGPYVGEGTNEIKITCSDIYSNSKSLSYVVNAISLRITSTFDDSQIYQGDVNVRYIPYGAIEKTIHFVVDGIDNTTIVSETGKQQTYTIPTMSHGSHMLKLYATAIINDVEITSNILLFDIMCVSGTGTTAMISSAYDVTSITQGELVNIGFSVYDPVNMTTEVELIIQQNDTVYFSTTRTVDRTRQFWSVRDYPVGEVTFTIRYGAISKSHIINVTESSVNISTKDTDLEFQLKAAGRSNSDNNREVWASGDVTTTFENFNWDSTGWVQDENGDVALRCSGDSRATINFMPFKSDARQTGRTIEMEFAIRDVNNRNAVAISCYSDGIGFTVTADTAKLMSEQSEISCNYTDEEKVHVAFVIEPRTEYRLMSVYLNGVLSGAKQYPENDNMQQTTTTNITVGSPYCSVDLYLIRSYNTALTEAEARDNCIADITDVGEKLSVIAENDIYDIYGNLSFSKLKDMLPILVITGDLPKAKGDKKNVLTTFTHPLYPQLNFEDTGKIDIQGTSSQWYIRKNYKIKYKQEHQHAVDQLPSNVFTWKADYAESTSTHNTGSANYVHTLYGDVKSPPQETNNKIRTTVYGYPALIFHKADSASEPEFIGRHICRCKTLTNIRRNLCGQQRLGRISNNTKLIEIGGDIVESLINHWIIYMYTFPNGKRYIGKTKRTLSERQGNNFSGYERCTVLWRAIQKYGINNIQQKILFEDDMPNEYASRLEQICILLFKSNCNKFRSPKFGYNLTDGGDGVNGWCPDGARLSALREQMKEFHEMRKGSHHSEEARRKMSEAKKGKKKGPLPDSVKKKISIANSRENMSEETHIRRSDSKKKKIIAIHRETKEELIFNSGEDVAEFFNVASSTVTRWCKKLRVPSVNYDFDYLSANND